MDSVPPWQCPGQHVYKGLTLPGLVSPAAMPWVENELIFREDDILIAAYPKSGTTWLQCIVYYILHPEEMYDMQDGKLVHEMAHFLEMFTAPGAQPDFTKFDKLPVPRLIKSHLPYNFLSSAFSRQKPRTIVLIRNPRDALVSYYHFYRMFESLGCYKGSWDSFFEMFKHNGIAFGNVIDHLQGWWAVRSNESTLVLRYDDLKANHLDNIRRIATFLGKEFSDSEIRKIQEVTSFANMKETPTLNLSRLHGAHPEISPFLRKGIVGDWQNHFSEEQRVYMSRQEEVLTRMNLRFENDA